MPRTEPEGVSCGPNRRTWEVIRVSQWAEIRHMHEVAGVAKKEVARRLGLDVKTVRRALARKQAPVLRRAVVRVCALDPHRARIEALVQEEPEITAKRIRRLLEGQGPLPGERAVR